MKLDKEKFIRGLRNAEAPLVRILGARKLTDQECEDMYEAACKKEEARDAAKEGKPA